MGHQLLVQLESVAITIVWSGVVAFIGYKLADMTVGLRVPEEQEREGLDVNSHGENATTLDVSICRMATLLRHHPVILNCDYALPLPAR